MGFAEALDEIILEGGESGREELMVVCQEPGGLNLTLGSGYVIILM